MRSQRMAPNIAWELDKAGWSGGLPACATGCRSQEVTEMRRRVRRYWLQLWRFIFLLD